MNIQREVSCLIGKTLASVHVNADESITFDCTDGTRYRMLHEQDCCESVRIDDVCGEWADLIGRPLIVAEESTSDQDPEGVTFERDKYADDSFTWTFYRFASEKGFVVVRWYGSSNGYYSESVDFIEIGAGDL